MASLVLAAPTAFASPFAPVLPIYRPPAPPAWVTVVTKPAGLRVRVGDVEAGWSPVAPYLVASGRVTVRAFPADPRRFDAVQDAATVDVAPGDTLLVALDLRPHPLLTSEPVSDVTLLAAGRSLPETRLGTTPIRVAPSRLEAQRVLFAAPGYADSVLPGALVLAMAESGGGTARVALRTLHLPPPAPPPGPSLFGRRWFQWALIGVGTALTGGAAALRHEGDRHYDRYKAATNPVVIEDEYDRTIRYDRLAATTLGTGQVLLTGGLFLLVSGVGR